MKDKNEKYNIKSNRISQALSLPVLCNMNPRSVYNKQEEFHTFVKEEEVDVVFLSESWERDYLPLDQIIKLEDHVVTAQLNLNWSWCQTLKWVGSHPPTRNF